MKQLQLYKINILHDYEEFLSTLLQLFKLARWFGIPSYGGLISCCWGVLMLLMLTILESAAIWKLVRLLAGWATNTSDGRQLVARLSGSIFYGNALLSLILSWRLLSSWKVLSVIWEKTENLDSSYLTPDVKIRRRIFYWSTFVAFCACFEHIMSMMSATGFDIPPTEYFPRYILSSHGFLLQDRKSLRYLHLDKITLRYQNISQFNISILCRIYCLALSLIAALDPGLQESQQKDEYSIYLAVPIFILSKLATILWNFQDLIIILISMGLTSRYRRLNCYVNCLIKIERCTIYINKDHTEMHNQVQVWRQVRQAYVRQAALVRKTDKEIGSLVLLSNVNNFYFICLQLFLGINKNQGSLVNRLYYFFSLSWLLFRACSVVLAAADVNVHSRRALPVLYACPAAGYNIEIKRLKNQLTYDFVALSGMGFFSLDRQLLLQVAAAIVKYELVLLQYDKQ